MSTERDATLPRVTELFTVIKSANDELEQIRKDCPHPSYTVGWWEWGAGRIIAQRICDRCRDTVDGITDEESQQLGRFMGEPTMLTFDNPEGPESYTVNAAPDNRWASKRSRSPGST